MIKYKDLSPEDKLALFGWLFGLLMVPVNIFLFATMPSRPPSCGGGSRSAAIESNDEPMKVANNEVHNIRIVNIYTDTPVVEQTALF